MTDHSINSALLCANVTLNIVHDDICVSALSELERRVFVGRTGPLFASKTPSYGAAGRHSTSALWEQ